MTLSTTISCQIDTTDASASLGFEAWVDDYKFFDTEHICNAQTISVEVDKAGEHELRFILKNKTPEHTKIDQSGNILKDARLIITNLAFDKIKSEQVFIDQAVYTHNFNGARPISNNKFYGEMGCNGTVSLRFSVPIYPWLIEHM